MIFIYHIYILVNWSVNQSMGRSTNQSSSNYNYNYNKLNEFIIWFNDSVIHLITQSLKLIDPLTNHFLCTYPISTFAMLMKLKPNAFFHVSFMYKVPLISAVSEKSNLPSTCSDVPVFLVPSSWTSLLTGTSISTTKPSFGGAVFIP